MVGDEATPPDFEVPSLAGVEDLLGLFLSPQRPDLSDGEHLDAVVALDRVRIWADAALVAAVDSFDARALCGADAMRSSQAWLRSRTEMSRAHAASVLHLARDLRDSQAVRSAYGDARLGTAKVKLLLAARVGVEVLFHEQVDDLIDTITELTVAETQTFLARWHEIAVASMTSPSDDDGPIADPEDDNSLFLSPTLDGRYKLDGDLDAVSGQATANAIEAEIAEWFRTGASSADDGETPKHRRARALTALIARGALPGEQQGQARPSVTLNIDLAEFLGIAIDEPNNVWARRCNLADATPIDRRIADRLMCEADITTVLTRTGLADMMEPLGAVHTKRYPTRSERRALALRDRGCVFPGCDAGVEHTNAHHLDHWHLHQRSELSRMVLLCRYHHHQVHEGGWQLHRDTAGAIDVTRPNGTRLPRARPGHLLREPTAPGATAGTGTPGTPRAAPTRPRTRFRTLTQRNTAAERAQTWWTHHTTQHNIRLVTEDFTPPDHPDHPDSPDARAG